MRRRLRWRWLRAKAWRLARHHYMFSFTLIALVAASAGALGYFDREDGSVRPAARQAVAPTRTLVPYNTPEFFIPPDPLTVTYYLVDNERDRLALENYENGIIFREILAKDAIEILLIRDEAEQARANQILEDAAVLAEESGFIIVVQDLRD